MSFYPEKALKASGSLRPELKCMPLFSVADIRISLLFEENKFCPETTNSFLWAALSPSMSSSFQSKLPELLHLFSPFKWPFVICIMSETLLKIVVYNNRSRHPFSNPSKKRDRGVALPQPCPRKLRLLPSPSIVQWPWTTYYDEIPFFLYCGRSGSGKADRENETGAKNAWGPFFTRLLFRCSPGVRLHWPRAWHGPGTGRISGVEMLEPDVNRSVIEQNCRYRIFLLYSSGLEEG